MKRARVILLRVALFGVLGAATTYGVGLGLWVNWSGKPSTPTAGNTQARYGKIERPWGAWFLTWRSGSRFALGGGEPIRLDQVGQYEAYFVNTESERSDPPSWMWFAYDDPSAIGITPGSRSTIICYATGWPFRSSRLSYANLDGNYAGYDWLRGGLDLVGTRSETWFIFPILPLEPIPSGFAANTAIYGLAWFSLAFGMRRVRRWRRYRLGLCVYCTYDLSGTTGNACPECGRQRP